jgi:hypothetical protein
MDSAPPLCITLIAVLSEDGFISSGTGVPWDLPADKAHFRAYTAGKWLLLGRKTYEEMLGWFRDHTPLVLTRQEDYTPPVGRCVGTLAEAAALPAQPGSASLSSAEERGVCCQHRAGEQAHPDACAGQPRFRRAISARSNEWRLADRFSTALRRFTRI